MLHLMMLTARRMCLLTLIVVTSLAMATATLAQGTPIPVKITAQNASLLTWQRGIGQGNLVNAMWSADGSNLYAVTSAGVYRYDPAHPDVVPTLISGNLAYTASAYLSDDGHWLATEIDQGSKLRITDLTTGEYWTAFEELKSSWIKVLFTDKLAIALSTNHRLWFYDVQQRRILQVVDAIFDVAMNPDGAQLALTDERGIGLWRLDALREIGRFSTRLKNGLRLAFSADGKTLYTLQIGRAFTSFDVATRKPNYQVVMTKGGIMNYAATGHLALSWGAVSDDRGIRIIDLETGETLRQVYVTEAASSGKVAITAAAISRDSNRMAALSWDGKLRVWDTETGDLLNERSVSTSGFLVFSPDNRMILYETASNLIAYDYAAQSVQTLSGEFGYNGTVIMFSPDGQRLTAIGGGGVIRWWEVGAWDSVTNVSLPAPLNRVYDLSYSLDSRELFVASDSQTLRYQMPALGLFPDPQAFFRLSTDKCRKTSYSSDGKFMACSTSGTAVIWDTTSNRAVWDYERDELDADRLVVTSVAFSPDSQQLAVAITPNRIDVVNTRDFNVKHYKYDVTEAFYSLTYSPDGKWLAAKSSDNVAYIFDAQSMTPKWSARGLYREYDNARPFITFSPDGSLVAASDMAQQVRLFEAATGKLVAELKTNTSGEGDYNIKGLAFSPDGTLLAGTTEVGLVMLWGVAE